MDGKKGNIVDAVVAKLEADRRTRRQQLERLAEQQQSGSENADFTTNFTGSGNNVKEQRSLDNGHPVPVAAGSSSAGSSSGMHSGSASPTATQHNGSSSTTTIITSQVQQSTATYNNSKHTGQHDGNYSATANELAPVRSLRVEHTLDDLDSEKAALLTDQQSMQTRIKDLEKWNEQLERQLVKENVRNLTNIQRTREMPRRVWANSAVACCIHRALLVLFLLAIYTCGVKSFTFKSGGERLNSVVDESSTKYGGKTDFNALFNENDDEDEAVHKLTVRTPSNYDWPVGKHQFDSESLFPGCLSAIDSNLSHCTPVSCGEDSAKLQKAAAVEACAGSLANSGKICFMRSGFVQCNLGLSKTLTSTDAKIRRAPAVRLFIWEQNITLACGDVNRAIGDESPPSVIRHFETSALRFSFLCLRSENKLVGYGCDFDASFDFRHRQCVKREEAKTPRQPPKTVSASVPGKTGKQLKAAHAA